MIFIYCRRYLSGAERGRTLFLIADGAALCGMLGAEACRFHYAGRMMSFCSECGGNLLGDIHSVAALVIQNNTIPTGTHSAVHAEGGGSVVRQTAVVSIEACRSNARRKTSGSSLPRAEALRRIPRQAF